MRLLVPDSFSYGDGSGWPWGGLIEPKLFQKVPWLLVVQLRLSIDIPLIDVGDLGVSFLRAGSSQVEVVCAYVSALEAAVSQALLRPRVSFGAIDATVSIGGVSLDVESSALDLLASQSHTSACLSSSGVGVSVFQASLGVD